MGSVTLASEEVDEFLEAAEKTFQLVTNVNKLDSSLNLWPNQRLASTGFKNFLLK
jgi:hypothetical protein